MSGGYDGRSASSPGWPVAKRNIFRDGGTLICAVRGWGDRRGVRRRGCADAAPSGRGRGRRTGAGAYLRRTVRSLASRSVCRAARAGHSQNSHESNSLLSCRETFNAPERPVVLLDRVSTRRRPQSRAAIPSGPRRRDTLGHFPKVEKDRGSQFAATKAGAGAHRPRDRRAPARRSLQSARPPPQILLKTPPRPLEPLGQYPP